MTYFANAERPVTPDLEAPDTQTLEGRASLVFKSLAVIALLSAVFALFPGLNPSSYLLAVSFNAATLALAAVYVATARGLDRRRPWAVSAVRPLLVLIAAVGVYTVVVALAGGVYRLPFETAFAIWALRGSADRLPLPRLDRRGVGLLAAAGVCITVMAFGDRVFGWGGVLDVRESDLQASIVVDCGPPGASPPGSLTVAYEWSWTRTSPLPNEVDMVVVGWTGNDAQGRPLYTVDDLPDPPPGIVGARSGALSRHMAEAARARSEANFQWAIDLNERGLQPGRVEIVLGLAREEVSGPRSVTFRATYIHLGIWERESEQVICAW